MVGLWRWRCLIAVALVGVAVSIGLLLQPDRVNSDGQLRFQIRNREYVLESAERFAARPESPLYLKFADDWASIDAGCSDASSQYKIVNGELIGYWMWTPLPCKGELALRIRSLNIFFRYPPSIEVDGDRVILTRGPVRLTFLDRRVANIGVPIGGRVWQVTTVRTSTWSTQDVGRPQPSLLLTDNHRIEIRTGCGSGTGNYTINGNQITFSRIYYDVPSVNPSLRVCATLQQILHDSTIAYRVDGKTLTMAWDTMAFTAETNWPVVQPDPSRF
jgi:heat shock protein HslJ